MTPQIFRTVMGWEPQQVNKLAISLNKAVFLEQSDWSRDPETLSQQLYTALSNKHSHLSYWKFIRSTLFDIRNREKKHQDKNLRSYWIQWRWYERSIRIVATFNNVHFNQIWQEMDKIKMGERSVALKAKLADIADAKDYIIFHDWIMSLKSAESSDETGSSDDFVDDVSKDVPGLAVSLRNLDECLDQNKDDDEIFSSMLYLINCLSSLSKKEWVQETEIISLSLNKLIVASNHFSKNKQLELMRSMLTAILDCLPSCDAAATITSLLSQFDLDFEHEVLDSAQKVLEFLSSYLQQIAHEVIEDRTYQSQIIEAAAAKDYNHVSELIGKAQASQESIRTLQAQLQNIKIPVIQHLKDDLSLGEFNDLLARLMRQMQKVKPEELNLEKCKILNRFSLEKNKRALIPGDSESDLNPDVDPDVTEFHHFETKSFPQDKKTLVINDVATHEESINSHTQEEERNFADIQLLELRKDNGSSKKLAEEQTRFGNLLDLQSDGAVAPDSSLPSKLEKCDSSSIGDDEFLNDLKANIKPDVESDEASNVVTPVRAEQKTPDEPNEKCSGVHNPPAVAGAISACAEGHFDVAFWLSWLANRNGESVWSHSVFSAFIFGSRISPGSVFGSELGTELNELAQKFPDNSCNRVILTSGLITPILFCADKPSSVYSLRDFAVTGLPNLDELFSNVVDLGVNKAVSITPFDVALAGVSTDYSKALEELAVESSIELHKAKVAKMAFWPGECLLHAIYREGMPLYTLHEIVSTNNKTRLSEARRLLESISPDTLPDSYELAPGFVPGRYPSMIGPARTRFLRYVNTTLSLARRWVDQTEAYTRPTDNFRRMQIDSFRLYIRKAIPAVVEEIKDHISRVTPQMSAALSCALYAVKRISRVMAGDKLQQERDIYTMLAPHPSVALDDDFMPLAGTEHELVRMLEEEQKPDPQSAFEAALHRKEFVRAKNLLNNYTLLDRSEDDYESALEQASSELLLLIDDLETRVEDAYLLGDLTWFGNESGKDHEIQTDSASQHAVRSEILGKLSSARAALASINTEDEPRIRDIIEKVSQVSKFTDEIKVAAQAKMQQSCEATAKGFPDTVDGREDRVYFLQRFASSTAAGDQVAAAEIIHQAENAIRRNERLTQTTTTGVCSLLREFEVAEPKIFDGLSQIDSRLNDVAKAIKNKESVFGLDFEKLEDSYVDSAVNALLALYEARDTGTTDSVQTFLPIVLSALGFETSSDAKCRVRGSDYRLYDYNLRFSPSCPVPSFGSNLRKKLTVLVLLRRFSDEETRDLIAQLGLKRAPFMAVVIHPMSMLMRQRLRVLCAHEHLEMITVDLVGILFALSRQNRQQTVFEITLPFAYTQPYQMKGENVPEETFVGREKEVDSLLDKDGACIVFGGRQLGKSATLRHLTNKYHNPQSGHYILYRDIDDLGAGAEPYEKVRVTFWEYIANEISLSGFLDLRAIATKGGLRIEEAVINAVKEVFLRDDLIRLTVLLDEADDLINLDAQHDFGLIKTIRGLMVDTNRRFKAVFAGLQSVQQFQRWKNHPFAQLGREIVIGPLPPDAAQRLVVKPMGALGFEFASSDLVLRIMSTVNYHPGLMQIFCHRLLAKHYEKASRQKKANGAVRVISREDLREVERTPALIEDIRDRFDWTLDLDDRYKLLIYALVLSENPLEPRTASEFQKLGAYWWGAEFAPMDLASTRSLLEEMEGLGVLVRIDTDGSRTYQLRSPNLLRLLGNRDVIEQEMERLIVQQSRRKANPREFHSFQSGKSAHFSPFTMGQDAEMFSRPEAAGITLVFGSGALGMARAEENIAKVAKALGTGTEAWARKEIGEQFLDNVERFAGEVVKFFRPRSRSHLYITAEAEAIANSTSIVSAVRDIQYQCKSTCSKNSKGRVFLLGGPKALWNWLIERRVSEESRRTQHPSELILQPWSDGAVWKGFEVAGIRNKAKQASADIVEKTGGFQFLIEDLISECRLRDITSADAALPLLDSKLQAITAKDAREIFGISDLPSDLRDVIESIFPLIIEPDKKTGYIVNRSGIAEVVGNLDSKQMDDVFMGLGRETATDLFVQWLTFMGLIRGTSHSSDVFRMPNIVETLCFNIK